jgi:hypothetical protein
MCCALARTPAIRGDSGATVELVWSDSGANMCDEGATVERQWSEYVRQWSDSGATVERQWSDEGANMCDEGDPSRNIFATVERLYTYEEDYTCII